MKNKARIEKVLVFNDSIFSIGDMIRVKTKNEVYIGRLHECYIDIFIPDPDDFIKLDCSEKNHTIIKTIHVSEIKNVTREEDQ